MKVLSIVGITKTGKTTTATEIIKELKNRGYSVGSVKEIHYEAFKIDTEGTNTDKHKKAGAMPVAALGNNETDIMYNYKMNIYDLLSFYHNDYVVLEGVREGNFPTIVTASTIQNLKILPHTIAISGVLTNSDYQNNDYPVINATKDIKGLVDLVERVVPDMLPDFDLKCCNLCGKGCRGLLDEIIAGRAEYSDCKLNDNDFINLQINGKAIPMVGFVKTLLKNNINAIVSELDGFKENSTIEIKLNNKKQTKA